MLAANAAGISAAIVIRTPNLAPGPSVWRRSTQSMSSGDWPFVEAGLTDGRPILPRGGAAAPSQPVWTVKSPFP
jgi:hypothetical protein